MIAIVILAAGASRRLGRAKQMEELGGETLLERAVRVAAASELGEVLAVVRADDAAVVAEARRLPCRVVLNHEAGEGMAASIRAGVRAAETPGGDGPTTAVLVMTCDQPAVTSTHLRELAATAGDNVVASRYAGRRGVPALFPARVFGELLELRGDAGAREMLREAPAIELRNGGVDIDTPAELDGARALFGGEPV